MIEDGMNKLSICLKNKQLKINIETIHANASKTLKTIKNCL